MVMERRVNAVYCGYFQPPIVCLCALLQTLRVPVSVTEQEEVQVRPPQPQP